jgi:ATP-dependent DNA helicase DinG
MQAANVLIVNHALYLTDLRLRAAGAGFLPEHQVVIFDEAHTLDGVASDQLGMRVTQVGLGRLLNRLLDERNEKGLIAYHKLKEAQKEMRRARNSAEEFWGLVRQWRSSPASGNGRLRTPPRHFPDQLVENLGSLATALDRESRGIEPETQRVELEAARDRLRGFEHSLRAWLGQTEADAVYWVEVEPRNATLAAAPLDLGPTLRAELFDRIATCILTSATLSTGRNASFRFVRQRLGLETSEALQLDSPFPYHENVTLHLVRDMPDPALDAAGFERSLARVIPHYLAASGGKAFVLFTSFRTLEAVEREVAPWLAQRGIRLLSQRDGMSRQKLIEIFRQDVSSVLFGVDSFWQGVDVPGEALSNVIITRLPFSVPDQPLAEARREDLESKGGQWFRDVALPEAVLKLKQGFGRLMRKRTDRGMVVILDSRILSKPYGRQFLDALPPCRRVIDSLGSIDPMG